MSPRVRSLKMIRAVPSNCHFVHTRPAAGAPVHRRRRATDAAVCSVNDLSAYMAIDIVKCFWQTCARVVRRATEICARHSTPRRFAEQRSMEAKPLPHIRLLPERNSSEVTVKISLCTRNYIAVFKVCLGKECYIYVTCVHKGNTIFMIPPNCFFLLLYCLLAAILSIMIFLVKRYSLPSALKNKF